MINTRKGGGARGVHTRKTCTVEDCHDVGQESNRVGGRYGDFVSANR